MIRRSTPPRFKADYRSHEALRFIRTTYADASYVARYHVRMIIIATVPLLVLIVGLILYLLPASASTSKVTEIGRLMFFCGLLVSVWIAAGHVVRL